MKGVREDGFNNDDEEVVEDPGFIKRMIGVRDKFKLGPHHKMERFTILVGAAIVFLLMFTVMGFASHRSDVANLSSSQASFTERFDFSLSGQSGQVIGVYSDESRQDSMVLFQFDDPSAMSSNAENYELFVTKDGRSSLSEADAPAVDFTLFGTTGYGVVRFQSQTDEPIQSQLMSVTIRANASLASDGSGAIESDDGIVDESFNDFDQAQMLVNPGAVNIETIEGLVAGETDPAKLYIPLVAEAEDATIRESIATEVSVMDTLLSRSDEYLGRIEASGFETPDVPWFIEGDEINDEGELIVNEDVARSHDIDIYDHTIRDGYLNQVIDNLSQYEDYMMSKSEAEADPVDKAAELQRESVPSIDTLTKTDGSTVAMESIVTGSSAAANVTAKDATESLLTTWREYLTAKQTVQRTLKGELIVLDADVRSQSELSTTHEDAATFY